MALIADINLNAEEFGFIPVGDLHQYNLQCKVICYDPSTTKVIFAPLKEVQLEARKSFYIIDTVKGNRVIITPDQLIYSNNNWVLPEQLVSGSEIWTNHARTIVSDAVSEIYFKRVPIRAYIPKIEGNLPFFANKILLKEQELIEDDTSQ